MSSGAKTWDLPPQGQRKESPELEEKDGSPCMEENELYSSSTRGEGWDGGALSVREGGGLGWLQGQVFLPCGYPGPCLSASLPGFLVWLKVVGTQPAPVSPLAQPVLTEAEGLGLDSLFVGPEVTV